MSTSVRALMGKWMINPYEGSAMTLAGRYDVICSTQMFRVQDRATCSSIFTLRPYSLWVENSVHRPLLLKPMEAEVTETAATRRLFYGNVNCYGDITAGALATYRPIARDAREHGRIGVIHVHGCLDDYTVVAWGGKITVYLDTLDKAPTCTVYDYTWDDEKPVEYRYNTDIYLLCQQVYCLMAE